VIERVVYRVNIDISVFAPCGSVGVVSGNIECPAIPRVGEWISFTSPTPGTPIVPVPGFTGMIGVESVIVEANSAHILLSLADVVLSRDERVWIFVRLMEQGHGLLFTPHPDWDAHCGEGDTV